MKPNDLIHKAKTSGFHLWLLNRMSPRMVPFNKPHGFRILEITDEYLRTLLPYRKSNFNHIRGLHATALATLAEFTSGFMLISRIDPEKFRIILQKIEVEYFYQGKSDAFGYFELDDEWLENRIYAPLEKSESTVIPCTVHIVDGDKKLLATGISHWQVKKWENVRTKR